MCPVLFSIPGPPTWAAVLLCLIFGAAAFALEAHEQRRLGTWQNRPRLALMTLVGVAFAFAISFALRRWGPVPVRSWGTMLMVGFLAGLAWVIWDTRDDDDVDVDTLIDVTLAILVGAVLGSRLLAVALNWSDFAGRPEDILKVWEGGLSFHGGLVGGFGAAALYLWRRGMSIPRMADVLTPSVAIGYAFTRVGCFLNGCCHGSPRDLPWAIHLTPLPGMLLLIRGHLRRPGHLFLSYLILYSISRSIMEVFRAGASAEAFGPIPALTVAQFASICIGLGAAALMYATRCRTAPAEEDAASETEAAREASTESR